MSEGKRIVFLDWLRVIAMLMVIVIHSCEPFYLGGTEGTFVANRADALWVTLVEIVCRVSVPLFVIASAYLLFPLRQSTGDFFRRRFVRVFIPFAVWAMAYVSFANGSWGKLAFNFPDEGGHLWFIPMLLGLYVAMPLFSPWAEKASEKEVRGWLIVWLVTTTFPFLRRIWSHLFGLPPFGVVPYLYGECPWNPFGAFHYVSGFFGYLLLGFWFRKFVPALSWRRTLAWAVPLWVVGAAIVGGFFYGRIPGPFPYSAPYAKAVDLEMSIEYCSTGVALTVIGAFLVFRKLDFGGAFYGRVIRPLSVASFGAYLVHMFILTPVFAALSPHLPTSLAIVSTAAVTFLGASVASLVLGKIPKLGKWLVG